MFYGFTVLRAIKNLCSRLVLRVEFTPVVVDFITFYDRRVNIFIVTIKIQFAISVSRAQINNIFIKAIGKKIYNVTIDFNNNIIESGIVVSVVQKQTVIVYHR